jgi:hypothetical protein
MTAVGLFGFVFWLGFPGFFHNQDIYDSLLIKTDHWHPVLIARFLEGLYALFGVHSYYLFALNLFCFYAGTLLFVLGLYARTRSVFSFAFFGVTAVGNIFFQNFTGLNNFGFSMLLWLACGLLFFQLNVSIRHPLIRWALRIGTGGVLLMALGWRHNAILSVYPLALLFIRLSRKPLRFSAIRCIAGAVGVGLLLICLVRGHPHLLSDNLSRSASNHIFLHQIVGIAVPSQQPDLIPSSWYMEGRSFDDAVQYYAQYPTFADPFCVSWPPLANMRLFKLGELEGLHRTWLLSVLKHPKHWMNHVGPFCRIMWTQEPKWIWSPAGIQQRYVGYNRDIAFRFPEQERWVQFSPLRLRIYSFLYEHKWLLNHKVGVWLGFSLLTLSVLGWLCLPSKRNSCLLYAFFTSLSTCITALGVTLFSPATDPRYMSPVLVLAIISTLGMICFVLPRYKPVD